MKIGFVLSEEKNIFWQKFEAGVDTIIWFIFQ